MDLWDHVDTLLSKRGAACPLEDHAPRALPGGSRASHALDTLTKCWLLLFQVHALLDLAWNSHIACIRNGPLCPPRTNLSLSSLAFPAAIVQRVLLWLLPHTLLVIMVLAVVSIFLENVHDESADQGVSVTASVSTSVGSSFSTSVGIFCKDFAKMISLPSLPCRAGNILSAFIDAVVAIRGQMRANLKSFSAYHLGIFLAWPAFFFLTLSQVCVKLPCCHDYSAPSRHYGSLIKRLSSSLPRACFPPQMVRINQHLTSSPYEFLMALPVGLVVGSLSSTDIASVSA